MKRLSSKTTFFYKRIFPIVWFGILIVVMSGGLRAEVPGRGPTLMLVLVPLSMAAFGWFIMKKLVWDLFDEVYDEGTTLLFRDRNREFLVSLKDIKNVSYSHLTSPPRVTLSLRYWTESGDELSFSPPASWIPFNKNRDIEELIDRIDRARG